MKLPVILFFGSTAVGKTDFLLKEFHDRGEVINADSMQVYRYLDIGTSKPDKKTLEYLPHYLISVVDPDKQFDSGNFVTASDKLVRRIIDRGKIPVVSGGTAFYFKNFLFGLPPVPKIEDSVRKELLDEFRKKGISRIYEKLVKIDPETAKKISSNDTYRIIRAMEIYNGTGRPLSSFKPPEEIRGKYTFLTIGIRRDRDILYRRIDYRVEDMFKKGLIEEIRNLIKMGYKEEDPGMRGIGYKEFFLMAKSGCLSFPGLKDRIKLNSRHYAKRQMTFFKKLPGVNWYDADDRSKIREKINKFVDNNF